MEIKKYFLSHLIPELQLCGVISFLLTEWLCWC